MRLVEKDVQLKKKIIGSQDKKKSSAESGGGSNLNCMFITISAGLFNNQKFNAEKNSFCLLHL